MPYVVLDFETKSGLNITTHGRHRYLNDPLADIICLGYRIEGDKETQLWCLGDPLPYFVQNPTEYILYAFNAQFDLMVWNLLGQKYGFPLAPLSCWIDVMALCGRFTFHQSLDQAGQDLDLDVKKNPRGKALMKKICAPPFEYTHLELMEFYEYCKTDVDLTYEVINALPASRLSDTEQKAWWVTCEINQNGLPIDTQAVHQILRVTEAYKEDQNTLLPGLTKGKITKATQTKRITQWLREQGVVTPNLQAETVTKLLEKPDLKPHIRTVLELRQELNRSSTAKYAKLKDLVYKGRIYDNERYYGSNTGRWAGMAFQLKNLPRSKVTNAQPIIDQFLDLSIIENNPIQAAKSIVRGMICAPKGKGICAVDFSAIEYILLVWAAGDEKAVERFRQNFDQYIDMAAYLYSAPYDSIDDQQRYFGKQLVLGCGYGLGAKGFREYAEGHGIDLDEGMAKRGVDAYREKYYRVVKFWYNCKGAALNAMAYPKQEFKVGMSKFKLIKDRNGNKWLRLTLPSGRPLYYNKPIVKDGMYGPEVTAMGINPYSKKWVRMRIIPGRFVENIIQALARDLLLAAKFKLRQAGFKIIGSVHDEVLLEVDENQDINEVYKLMCIPPKWAPDFPLKAEGVIEKRYRKM